MEVKFKCLVKEVKMKNLVSLDKGFEVKLQGEDKDMIFLSAAPADTIVNVTINWE